MAIRATSVKALLVGLLSAGFLVLAGYFLVMDLVVIPRAEATIDRVGLHLAGPEGLAAGGRGALLLRVDNSENPEPVTLRDVVLAPQLAALVRLDGPALRAQAARLEGDRAVWDRQIPAGGRTDFTLPLHAVRAGRQAGAVRVLFQVPRLTKGRILPLTIEVR